MKKYIFLFLMSVLYAPAVLTVTITPSGGPEFKYTSNDHIKALCQSELIKNSLTDCSDIENVPLPLPGVDAACWQHMFECLLIMASHQPDDNEAIKKELDDKIAQLSNDELCTLLNACDYVQAPEAILNSALDRCSVNPEFLLANNTHAQLYPHVQEALHKKLGHYLRQKGIANPDKPVAIKEVLGLQEMLNNEIASLLAQKIRVHTNAIQVKPGGDNKLFCSIDHSIILIWDMVNQTLLHRIKDDMGEEYKQLVLWDDYLIVTTSKKIHVWNLATQGLVLDLDCTPYTEIDTYKDGLVVLDRMTGDVQLFNTALKADGQFATHPIVVACTLNDSQDHHYLATCTYTGAICVWDAKTGTQVKQLNCPCPLIHNLHFSPQGNLLGVVTDGGLSICDVNTGNCIATFNSSYTSCFFDDQHALFVKGKGMYLYDLIATKRVKDFEGHQGNITSLWIPQYYRKIVDTDLVCTASHADKTIRIWHIPTGTCTHVLDNNPKASNFVFFKDQNYFLFSTHNKMCIADVMGSMQKLIDESSLEQRLLLALGYHKKKLLQTLDVTHKPHLAKLLGAYDKDKQALIQKILPLQLSA